MRPDVEAVADDVTELADELVAERCPWDGMDTGACVALLARLADAKDALQATYRLLEHHVWTTLQTSGAKEWQEGPYALTRRGGGPKTTYDKPMLVSAVYNAALDARVVDEETGEIEDTGEAVHRAYVDAFALHTQSASVRRTWCQQHGIDLEAYEEATGERVTRYLQWTARPQRGVAV